MSRFCYLIISFIVYQVAFVNGEIENCCPPIDVNCEEILDHFEENDCNGGATRADFYSKERTYTRELPDHDVLHLFVDFEKIFETRKLDIDAFTPRIFFGFFGQ